MFCLLKREEGIYLILSIQDQGLGGHPSNEERVSLECPFLVTSLPGSAVDWNYTTVSQTGLQGRILNYARGYVLGGSSSISAYLTRQLLIFVSTTFS